MSDEPETNNCEGNEIFDDFDSFDETLSHYIARIEKAEEEKKEVFQQKVITSKDLPIEPKATRNLSRTPILWRVYQHAMFYVDTVKCGTKVARHHHTEDIFRLVTNGSLTLHAGEEKEEREHKLAAGDWFLVRAGTPYHIDTPEGYTVLAGYKMACKGNQ